MRKLLLLLALCAPMFAQCSNTSYGNGWTCIQQGTTQNAGSGTTATVTLTNAITVGHSLVVTAEYCGDASCNLGLSTTATPTSGGTDTFITAPSAPFTLSSGVGANIKFYAWAITASNSNAAKTFTVTCSATCYYLSVKVSEWTGMATSTPFDVAGALQSSGTGTSVSVSAGTTTNATDLVYGVLATYDSYAVSPGSGFTEIGEAANGWEHEAKSVVATGAQSCTWTIATATNWGGMCFALKAGAGGGGGGTTPRRRFIQ